jgi:putative restriction endonuclease
LSTLRQAWNDGKRMPHKPLLVLLALGRFAESGSSELPWSIAQNQLGGLIAEFGPPSRTGSGFDDAAATWDCCGSQPR